MVEGLGGFVELEGPCVASAAKHPVLQAMGLRQVGAALAAQAPDGVGQLHNSVAAANGRQLRNIAVLKIHPLLSGQVRDGEHRALGGSNERPDLGDQAVDCSGVVPQARANDREVIEVEVRHPSERTM